MGGDLWPKLANERDLVGLGVAIFDLGEEGDQPYVVTELMGAGAAEDFIEKADDHRIPLEQALELCSNLLGLPATV